MGAVLVGTDGAWQAKGRVPAGRSAVLVQPALASVLGPRVTLRVASDDPRARLFAGRTRPDDARDLVAGSPYTDVTGLDGSRRLRTTRAAGAQTLPAPAQVDLWHQQAEGTGSVRLGWRPTPGAETFVVMRSDGAPLPALDVTMSWQHAAWRWLPVDVALAGALLLLLAWPLRRLGRRSRGRGRGGSADRTRRAARVQPSDATVRLEPVPRADAAGEPDDGLPRRSRRSRAVKETS
jgi:hypothetical protein